MKSDKLHTILLLIAIAMMTMAFFNVYFNKTGKVVSTDTVFVTKTDTLWRDTTIIKDKPVEKKVVEVRRDTVFTPGGDTLQLITEHKTYQERLLSGKDTADVQVYTTGINTSVDSLKMRFRTHTEVVTNTIEITKYIEKKRKFHERFHFSPNVSAGYGVFNRNLDVDVGFGVAYEL